MLERFRKTDCKKKKLIRIRIEKVIKRKDDKLYLKWNGYNDSFSSWIYIKNSINE